MTYREKMINHLRRAEELNAEVDKMEARAMHYMGLVAVTDGMEAYKMKKHFEHDELYKQKGNARNVQLNLALINGIAALVTGE